MTQPPQVHHHMTPQQVLHGVQHMSFQQADQSMSPSIQHQVQPIQQQQMQPVQAQPSQPQPQAQHQQQHQMMPPNAVLSPAQQQQQAAPPPPQQMTPQQQQQKVAEYVAMVDEIRCAAAAAGDVLDCEGRILSPQGGQPQLAPPQVLPPDKLRYNIGYFKTCSVLNRQST